jgi:hypothetical protein
MARACVLLCAAWECGMGATARSRSVGGAGDVVNSCPGFGGFEGVDGCR